MTGCLSELALDDWEIHGQSDPTWPAHLDGCPACRARLVERRALVSDFQDRLAAPTWARITGAAARRRRTPALGFLALAAVAASLLLVVGPRRIRKDPRSTPKGSSLAEIICRRGDRTFVIGSGDEVVPGDRLRFRPLPVWPDAHYIQIGSVDGTGSFSSFYPAGGEGFSVPIPPDGAALDGSIRLDGAPGPERLLVVLSKSPIASRDVRQMAEAHAAHGDRVERIGAAQVASAWIVLPKRGGSPAAP
jgi:hypothetical protein